jgi:ABC-type branched-subunit amino acid transport system substrate-binding protein
MRWICRVVLARGPILAMLFCLALAPGWAAAATPGVTPKEIRLGTHAPLSGPASPFGDLARAMEAYFRSVNEAGGVNGRQIKLLIEDDGYRPDAGEEAVRRLVRRDHVLAVVGAMGDTPHARAVDFLNNDEVPDLFATGGALALSRPPRRWTIAMQPSYRQEGGALGQIAAREFRGKRVALVSQTSELGSEGAQGFRETIRTQLSVSAETQLSVAEGDLSETVKQLRASGAQVVAVFAVPGLAARLISAAAKAGWSPEWVLAADCAVPELIDWAGRRAADGAVSLAYLPLADDQRDLRVAKHRELLARYGSNLKPSAYTIYGQAVAELVVESLKRAGPEPTVATLMQAVESLDNWNDDRRALAPVVNVAPRDHQALHAARAVTVKDGHWVAGGDWISAPALQP